MHYAFDIGGSKLEFGVFNEKSKIVFHKKFPTPSKNRIIFIKLIKDLVDFADYKFGISNNIGISVAGSLDPKTGYIISANIPVLTGWSLAQELSQILQKCITIQNDTDCFALSELHTRYANKYKTIFAITLGTGVGGSLIINGKLMSGKSGIIGEWGHGNNLCGQLSQYGLRSIICGCGKFGCLDSWGGARGLENIYSQIYNKTLSSIDITRLWHQGDLQCDRCIKIFIDLIAQELAFIINILDPEYIPVGGSLALEKKLIDKIDDQVRNKLLRSYQDKPIIIPGNHCSNGSLRGASLLYTTS